MDAPYYTIEGKRYARVTSSIKVKRSEELEVWRGKVGNKEANATMRRASSIGTRVHDLIEAQIKGDKVGFKKNESTEVVACVEAFQEWVKSRKPVPLYVEKLVWDEALGYAGTIDLVEHECITDWKTGGRVSPEYWMQLAAYAKALNLPSIQKVRVVRLDKTLGTFEEQEKTIEELEPYWQAFQGLLQFYKEWEQIGEQDEHSDRDSKGDATDAEDEDKQEMAGPEVSDDRHGEDGQVRVLGARREDPLSGM